MTWEAPLLNPSHHAEIDDYHLECLFLEGAADVADPGFLHTGRLQHIFYHLYPHCTYRLRIRCHSVSGWSSWSSWVCGKTLAHQTEAPLPVEVCKVSTNSLILRWFAPKRDNGYPVDYYDMEVVDYQSVLNNSLPLGGVLDERQHDDCEEDNNNSNGCTSAAAAPPAKLSRINSRKKLQQYMSQQRQSSLAAIEEKEVRHDSNKANSNSSSNNSAKKSSVSKLYRMYKHKDVDHLIK